MVSACSGGVAVKRWRHLSAFIRTLTVTACAADVPALRDKSVVANQKGMDE
jgi:hypothetical protein